MKIRPLDGPGDLDWVARAHGELYADEFGWDAHFEAMVAEVLAGYTGNDPREAGWIAELDGDRVGSILCTRHDDTTAKLRVLLVHPKARGHGAGQQLVRACLDFAKNAGYERIALWTVAGLDSARKIYEANGFVLTKAEPHPGFGTGELVGQTWVCELRAGGSRTA